MNIQILSVFELTFRITAQCATHGSRKIPFWELLLHYFELSLGGHILGPIVFLAIGRSNNTQRANNFD